jgi:hypothetical protein
MAGMLESEQAKEGRRLDLSEEYLGFWNIFITAYRALEKRDINELSDGASMFDALELVEKLGVVPESVFSHKFAEDGPIDQLVPLIEEILKDDDLRQKMLADQEELYKVIAEVFGATPPLPEDEFLFEGKKVTSVELARQIFGFRADQYVISLYEGEDILELTEYIKTSLLEGHTIPVGVDVYKEVPNKGWFDLRDCRATGCESDGGHAMLVVDFKTRGGRFGAMNDDDVVEVFDQPLEALLVKNSWGPVDGLTQSGSLKGNTGFYGITAEYMNPDKSDIKGETFAPMLVLRRDMMHLWGGK